ncbi:hypothetical protein A3K63_01145 [Candidatus Micrarchaeota archaeon RBG_16_49_10]|nr:MAG: hypothetical protein A3K63_01145 [Candidatus Micrarchaeota archaeon RBG_16_49_10]
MIDKRILVLFGIALLVVPILAIAQDDLPTPKVVPGHWAYALKRGWEKTQMIFTWRHIEKAKMHLGLAKERLGEAKAIYLNNTERVKGLVEEYEKELSSAEKEINISKGIGQNVSQIVKEIENSTEKHKAVLQLVLAKVPETAKDSIQSAIDKTEEVKERVREIEEEPKVGTTLKITTTTLKKGQVGTTQRKVVTGKGTLLMQITDKPVSGNITSVLVTISKVEVHKASENDSVNESGWVTVTEEPKEFDLLKIKDVKEFLASKDLSVGKYTQVRLYISNATIVTTGGASDLEITSKSLKLVNEFDIEEGKVTIVTIDFDADKSVVSTGSGRYKLKPTIKILEAEGESTTTEPATTESTTTTETTTLTETTTPQETTTLQETTTENTETTTIEVTTTPT